MLPDQLTDFVQNTAQAGDVAITKSPITNDEYIYFCTKENIGKDANPCWMKVDKEGMLKNMFERMTLEEKVNFLIDKYIQDNI